VLLTSVPTFFDSLLKHHVPQHRNIKWPQIGNPLPDVDGNNVNVQNLNNREGETREASGNDNQDANAEGNDNVEQGNDNDPNKDKENKANQEDPNMMIKM
jgi:hypothetical protein